VEAKNTFDILHDLFAKIYNLLECVVIDELILKFKGQVIFRQAVPKKNKHCGIKMGYTCDMNIYLDKDSQTADEK